MKVRIMSANEMVVKQNNFKKRNIHTTTKSLTLIAFCLLFATANLKAAGNEFFMRAVIKGLPAGLKVTMRDAFDEDAKPLITSITYLGGFRVHKLIGEPIIVKLVVGDDKITEFLFIEPGTLKMKGNYTNPDFEYSELGSQKDFEFCMLKLIHLKDSIKTTLNNKENEDDVNERNADGIRQLLKGQLDSFLANRNDSFSAAMCLNFMTSTFKSNTELEPFYNSLTKRIQQSRYGLPIGTAIEKAKIAAIGSIAKDFELKDTAGNIVHLSDYRGKYVLLDFWASWCKPCRGESPVVVEAYNTYHNKNFEILSVSLDKEKQDWLDAIKEDGLKWRQVSDLMEWDSPIAKLYGVEAIPTNFLIDPNGVIIAKNLRGLEVFKGLRTKLK